MTNVRGREKFNKVLSELHIIPIKTDIMQNIGIDTCSFPEADGFKHLIAFIDYFSKWSEAKPIKDKSASTITQFR